MSLLVPILLATLAVLTVQDHPRSSGDRDDDGLPFATRSPVLGRHGMVCTSHPLATQIGLDVLKEGGSAVDAAIAANAALGLMEPTSCGIGGDLFVLLWDPVEKRLVGLNGSGRSSRSTSLEWLREQLGEDVQHLPLTGGLPVTVPGCVDGWVALHERYGRLPLARLLAPSIAAAREGFAVTPVISAYWRSAETGRYGNRPEFDRVFLPGGRAPRAGDVFRNPDLADTYAALAEGGRAAFYEGAIAADIVACVDAAGGRLTRDDLAQHRSEWVTPLSVPYRGHEVWELPPNGQGIAVLQMLRLLEPYELRPWDGLTFHRMIEAKKLAFEDRARFYCDPSTAKLPLEQLLSAEYADERRARIDDARASTALPAGDLPIEHDDTIYLTVADDDGLVVSWIQSNYTGFGSGLVPEGRGFGLQNRGQMFHLDPGHANAYAPGKRPFHTIIPALMTKDGVPVLSFGVMGGAMQPQGHVQIVVDLLDFGFGPQEAGDAPRWRHEGSSEPTGETMTDGGVVHLETGVPAPVVEALRARGHRVQVHAGGFGGYQAIWIDGLGTPERLYWGASESRKDGQAAGW